MSTTPPEPDQPFGAGQPSYPGDSPAHGSYPSQGSTPPATVEQPTSISTAVKLMLAGAVISVLSLIYSLATIGETKDTLREEVLKNDPNASQSTIDAAIAFGIGFAVVLGLLGALLWVWMAWKNGQGRSWARVVATVFGGLAVLSALFTLSAGNAETVSVAVTVINLVLAAVILFLLWRPESSRFYEASTASRQLR